MDEAKTAARWIQARAEQAYGYDMTSYRINLLIATLLLGLGAGFFFTYQASVTPALTEVDDDSYVLTFQAINSTIQNPAFGMVFFGSIAATGLLVVQSWMARSGTQRLLVGAALGFYAICVVITATGNVPLNDELEAVGAVTGVEAKAAREAFESQWNRLNLWRTLTSTSGFACLTAACLLDSDS